MSWILDQIRNEIQRDRDTISNILRSGATFAAYEKMNQIASQVGANYGVQVLLNFPTRKDIFSLESVAMKNVSIIVDASVKKFVRCPEDQIRLQLLNRIPNAKTNPVQFGHAGFHANFDLGRLTVLPSGVHVWCEVDSRIREFLDWLFPSVYGVSKPE